MVTEQEWDLVERRLEQMPETMRMAVVGYGALTKDEVLSEVRSRSAAGELIMKQQMNYLKWLKKKR